MIVTWLLFFTVQMFVWWYDTICALSNSRAKIQHAQSTLNYLMKSS